MRSLLVIVALPRLALAGIGDPIVQVVTDAVDGVKAVVGVLLIGYAAWVAYKWMSAAPDAQRHTLFLMVGGVIFANIDNIIAAMGGQ